MTTIRQRLGELKAIRYDWMLMIILCSLLGFIVENVWNYLTTGNIDNRNMFLPFLLGYGIAILLVYIFFGVPTKKNLPLYMVKVVIFTTTAEIALGYLVQAVCGFRYWDYTDLPLHFTPYASVFTSLGFMLIISLFMFFCFQNLMDIFQSWASHKPVRIIVGLMTCALIIDMIASFIRMFVQQEANMNWIFSKELFSWISNISSKETVVFVAMFFVYSFLGWCMESAWISFLNKKWTNRGMMHIPFCPIYGFGEAIGYRLLLLLPRNYILYFVIGLVFCTILEFVVAKVMIARTGYLWWDYTKRPFNYKGILSLESSLMWGAIAVVEMWFLHTGIEGLLSSIPTAILAMIVVGLIALTFGDLFVTLRKLKKEGMQAEENNILKVR